MINSTNHSTVTVIGNETIIKPFDDLIGLSTDEKPLGYANGSTFLEINTETGKAKVFIFDEENMIWREL